MRAYLIVPSDQRIEEVDIHPNPQSISFYLLKRPSALEIIKVNHHGDCLCFANIDPDPVQGLQSQDEFGFRWGAAGGFIRVRGNALLVGPLQDGALDHVQVPEMLDHIFWIQGNEHISCRN